jgi:PAS domain S-box-containing protein
MDDRLELFFSQSLDGFFFMMLDEPVRWDDSIDKDAALDYVFAHQHVTKVNDAMLAQYGVTREQFLGTTPADLFRHDLEYGRRVWREFFDHGRLHVETDERRADGTPIRIEGDYICFYDDAGRITGHFGIQRDVSDQVRLRRYLQEEIRIEGNFGEIVGIAESMQRVFRDI